MTTSPKSLTLDKVKMEKFKKTYASFFPSSSSMALQMAIKAEQTMKDVGAFDPAFRFFAQHKIDFEEIAIILEKEGK